MPQSVIARAEEQEAEAAREKTRRPRRRSGKQPVVLTRARVCAIAVIGVAWALLSQSLGAAILPSDTISNWWHDWRQSDTEEAVEKYVDEVQDGAIWAQPPTVYESSVTYFEENYEELDPNKVHDFPRIDAQQPLLLSFLATESAGWTGRIVLVSADVQEPPRLVVPVTEEIGSYRIALRDIHVPGTEIICRLPFKRTLPFDTGHRVTFTGLVLADGLAERERGAGMKRAIYMACASMVRSMSISMFPRSRRGGKMRRPVIEINE
jgi:hypothetical protein